VAINFSRRLLQPIQDRYTRPTNIRVRLTPPVSCSLDYLHWATAKAPRSLSRCTMEESDPAAASCRAHTKMPRPLGSSGSRGTADSGKGRERDPRGVCCSFAPTVGRGREGPPASPEEELRASLKAAATSQDLPATSSGSPVAVITPASSPSELEQEDHHGRRLGTQIQGATPAHDRRGGRCAGARVEGGHRDHEPQIQAPPGAGVEGAPTSRSRGGGSADLLDPVVPSSPLGWSSGAAPHPCASAPKHRRDPPHRRDVDGARSAVAVQEEEQGSAVQGRTSRSPRPLRFFLQDAQPASTRRRTLSPRLRGGGRAGAGVRRRGDEAVGQRSGRVQSIHVG
jgi:hypothetical protein